MANLFNSVKQSKVRRNAFNLSYDHKFTGRFGRLIPFHVQECLPNDTFKGKSSCLIRLANMLAPVMHRVNVYTHFFFVPNRILWEPFQYWITGKDETSEPPWFAVDSASGQAENSTLLDYMGMPSSDAPVVAYDGTDAANNPYRQFNALPLAAYQRIWYEFYRDQNLQGPDSTVEDLMLQNGSNPINVTPDVDSLGTIRKRAWTKDYFASALPWPQKGDAVTIPIGFDEGMPVHSISNPGDPNNYLAVRFQAANGAVPTTGVTTNFSDGTISGILDPDGTPRTNDARGIDSGTGSGDVPVSIPRDDQNSLRAYPSEMVQSAGTIEDLRRAFRLERWLELNARGGTRYNESIKAHFDIMPKDYRLQRPEYIGGSKSLVQISEVLQTSSQVDSEGETEGTNVGAMYGHGIAAGYGGGYNYRCFEHGWIIGIVSVTPVPAYYQGVPRHFGARKDRLDYAWPIFANLGEQPIQQKELVYVGDTTPELAEDTFGYTPRYAEYRKNDSRVSGDFNSNLDFWHLARKFSTVPLLNDTFIEVDGGSLDDLDRIFAVQDGTDYLWCHIYNDIKAIRPLPRYATPY